MTKLFKRGNLILQQHGFLPEYVIDDMILSDIMKLRIILVVAYLLLPIQYIFDKWSFYYEKTQFKSFTNAKMYTDIFR